MTMQVNADTDAAEIRARAERWASPHGLTDQDRERAELHESDKRELERALRPILSPELWTQLLNYGAEPDAHQSCDWFRESIIEGIALHFGQMAPTVRAIALHVMDDHDGSAVAECGLVLPDDPGARMDDPPPAA